MSETLESAALAAGGIEWTWWTSNSTLRLTSKSKQRNGSDGDVLEAHVTSDGTATLSCPSPYREFIEYATPSAVLALISQLSISQQTLATTIASNAALNTQVRLLQEMLIVSAKNTKALRETVTNDPTLKELGDLKDDNSRFKERTRFWSRMARVERDKNKELLSEIRKLKDLLKRWLQSANVSDYAQASLSLETNSTLTKSSTEKKIVTSGGAE